MPTIVALIGGNFTGRARANAYATIAAAAAVAVGLGPIIGGFVTAEWTWRWVFAAEVPIALGILVASRVIRDAPVEERPTLGVIGAVLSAAGIAVVVFGVLLGGAWGWGWLQIAEG